MYDLGTRFKAVRTEKKLTQRQAANGIGIPERQYQYYEYGKNTPSALILCSLADYFDVPLDYLAGRGIYANWEQVLQHWDLVIDAVGKVQFPFGGKMEESIKSYLRATNDDKIKAGELLSALIFQIEFKSSDKKLEVVFHWKFS